MVDVVTSRGRFAMSAIGRRPIPEPPRQSPAACSYAHMCAERQRFIASLWGWLSSGPAPGDAMLELSATQSAVQQLAEIAGNASAAR
jgi:hypothetical protein